LLQGGSADGQQAHERVLSITGHHGNANQNHKDIPPHTPFHGNLISIKTFKPVLFVFFILYFSSGLISFYNWKFVTLDHLNPLHPAPASTLTTTSLLSVSMSLGGFLDSTFK